MLQFLPLVAQIFGQATKVIDDVHTSDEEKAKLKNAMLSIQAESQMKALEIESQLIDAKANIITAEAQGQSWLQRNWRPITMLTFLVLIICDSFGLLAFRLASEAWLLLQIGLGGYVVGRTGEKLADKYMNKQ